MRETLELAVEPRAKLGKGAAYQTRKAGRIPAVVYGGEASPEAVQVDERTLTRLYSTGSFLQTLVMLESGGKKTRVIPRAVQLDPVTDRPVHVDFMRLTPGGTISLDIPVHFRGQESSPGIKRGGVVNIVRHEVALLCPVDNIPEFIEGDLSVLDIGDSLHISAFALPEGVRPMIQGRDFTVATIAPPTTYTEEAPVAAAAAEGAAPAEGAEGAAPAAGAAAGAAAPAAAAKGKAPEKK
ncbi:MAG TPA: 50S ribosomal protein L25/general stress protein Ctc [Micropepsaceae bacterium]|jgi:large subunit ribosomal protein L25|nr:50S ribosomal protein L25/general stress protein Ctc [Micropepsaceae bacterium]